MQILIADDHRVVRSGLRLLLETQPDMGVVGEASSGPEALDLARKLKPDLAILDLSMPGGAGLEYLTAIAAVTSVLVLTMHDDLAYVQQVMQAGGSGYVLKEATDVELLAAVRAVSAGQTYVHPTLAARLIRAEPRSKDPAVPLSPREGEVLRLVALGHTNQEIADQLQVGVRTVETYKQRVCEKLGLFTRSEMVRYALEHKLI